MSLTLQQLETGKTYVFRLANGFYGELAATFVSLQIADGGETFVGLVVRDLESEIEQLLPVSTIAKITTLTREWLEGRMAEHATQVLVLQRFASNLLNARKELS